MEQQIKEYLQNHNITYIPIFDEHTSIIYDLFFKDIVIALPDAIVSLYHGIYYSIKKDYYNAVKYYAMSAQYGNIDAMNAVGYYCYMSDNYENATRYYMMAVELGCSNAMADLAMNYNKCNDFENAVKYSLMAIEHGNITAMNNLSSYYYARNDFANATKYLLCAVDHGNYYHVDNFLKMCPCPELVSYQLQFANRILNKTFNNQIMDFIVDSFHLMNVDMVNIIVNIEGPITNGLFSEFKNLVTL